jgi:hypothetical protein
MYIYDNMIRSLYNNKNTVYANFDITVIQLLHQSSYGYGYFHNEKNALNLKRECNIPGRNKGPVAARGQQGLVCHLGVETLLRPTPNNKR